MPGIVGIITQGSSERATAQLQKMLSTLRHEPWYEMGSWSDASLGVYVGWSALQKPSPSQVSSCYTEDGNTLIFSGEEFPSTVESRSNVQSRSASLLKAYATAGNRFAAGLNGRFHAVVADRTRGVVTLYNDRYGMHRLYWTQTKDAVYFSAEAKAILEVCPELKTADPRGFGELVSCGCVLDNRTLFKGIQVLPGASAWSYRSGSLESKETYFHPSEWEQQQELDAETYYDQLRDVFAKNLERYFTGDKRIGISLTGGLDTRALMAWLRDARGKYPCYTFGGTYRESRDVKVAREVATACGQTHQVIGVDDEFLNRFPHYAERTLYLTDGCTGVSHSPDLYVAELARQIAPVRVTGNYGDEVLRQIRVFRPVTPVAGLYCSEFESQVEGAENTFSDLTHTKPLSFAVFRQGPWHHYGLLALEQTQVAVRSPFLDNEIVQTVFRSPASTSTDNNLRVRLIADGNPELAKIPTDLGFGGSSPKLIGRARQRLHAFSMKAEYAYDYGMPQWLAKIDNVFRPLHFERRFLGRHKFYHFRVWYRDKLSQYVQEILLDPRTLTRPYLKPKTVERMVCAHIKGEGNYTSAIHQLLNLELIHRLFLDPK